MPKHLIKVAAVAPKLNKESVVAVVLSEKNAKLSALQNLIALGLTAEHDLARLGASNTPDAITRVPGPNGSVIALVGGYKAGDLDALRHVGGTIGRTLGDFRNVYLDIDLKNESEVTAILEGYSIGHYSYDNYKSNAKKQPAQNCTLLTKLKVKPATLTRVSILSNAVHDTRDLVSMPANDLYPQSFVSAVNKLVRGAKLTVTVLDEKKLAAGGFGGLVGVGKGSVRPPRLVKIEYKPAGAKFKLALVGKGITYDTGGLSLKPAASMLGMKYDMTGAATILNAIIAIARLKVKVHTTAYLCLAENMPSGTATRPGDVIKVRNGKTIEVTNTDAEGRLVLADGLSLASEAHPDLIVDVATLTGAQRIALGARYAGLMGDEKAVEIVLKAAKTAGELAWHMPMPDELRNLMKSDIADLQNAKVGNTAGGMLFGGIFLREFIGKKSANSDQTISWAHLDIAGPADNDGAGYGFIPKGASGSYVRTLITIAEQSAR
ncbi:MAG: leucyl aminopeptidase [Micrococcales bacterium]